LEPGVNAGLSFPGSAPSAPSRRRPPSFYSSHLLASVARREAQQDAVPDPARVIGFVFHGVATHLLNNAIARELERSGLIDDQ
jgi:hypothetical protein